MMESLWATLKKELVHGRRFRTQEEARLAVFEWIEVWYQRTRIHGSLGYVSPEAFEAAARVGQDQDGCPRVLWKSTSTTHQTTTIRSSRCPNQAA
jgi:hypothetical protein